MNQKSLCLWAWLSTVCIYMVSYNSEFWSLTLKAYKRWRSYNVCVIVSVNSDSTKLWVINCYPSRLARKTFLWLIHIELVENCITHTWPLNLCLTHNSLCVNYAMCRIVRWNGKGIWWVISVCWGHTSGCCFQRKTMENQSAFYILAPPLCFVPIRVRTYLRVCVFGWGCTHYKGIKTLIAF